MTDDWLALHLAQRHYKHNKPNHSNIHNYIYTTIASNELIYKQNMNIGA